MGCVIIFLSISCLALILIPCSLLFSCRNNERVTAPNAGIINIKDFYVAASSTGLATSARGTIFISGENDRPTKAEIVAWVEVDPEDFGGVRIYLPYGWKMTGLVSGYPEGGIMESYFDRLISMTFGQIIMRELK